MKFSFTADLVCFEKSSVEDFKPAGKVSAGSFELIAAVLLDIDQAIQQNS